jgi:hypothetical protein
MFRSLILNNQGQGTYIKFRVFSNQSLREINNAISQLNEAAQGLRKEISHFKVAT